MVAPALGRQVTAGDHKDFRVFRLKSSKGRIIRSLKIERYVDDTHGDKIKLHETRDIFDGRMVWKSSIGDSYILDEDWQRFL